MDHAIRIHFPEYMLLIDKEAWKAQRTIPEMDWNGDGMELVKIGDRIIR